MASVNPKRGEIWWVELEPVRGSEQATKRPVVVVSHANYGRPTGRLGVPIMEHKSVHVLGAWYIKLEPDNDNGLGKTSSADASQVRALDIVRFDNRVGQVTPSQLSAIVAGVKMGIEDAAL